MIPAEIKEFLSTGGKILIVTGDPGSGKTTFVLTLLKEVGSLESNVYVSTRVDARKLFEGYEWLSDFVSDENILDASSHRFTSRTYLNPSKLREKSDLAKKLLDQYQPSILTAIYKSSIEMERPMIIIDPWDAVLFHLNVDEDAKLRIEESLCDFASKSNANFILVGEERGKSIEYFVDGIVNLKIKHLDDRIIREIWLEKLRNTAIKKPKYLFTLNESKFKSFYGFKSDYSLERREFEPIPHTISHFSSGSELDEITGGIPRGTNIFIETTKGVPTTASSLLIMQIIANWIHQDQDHGITMISSAESSPKVIKTSAFLYGFEDKLDLIYVLEPEKSFPSEEFVADINAQPDKIEEDWAIWKGCVHELRENTGNPVLHVIGFDTLEYHYNMGDLKRFIMDEIRDVSDNHELSLLIGRESTEQSNKHLAVLSDIHLRLDQINGSVILYGVKPETGVYDLQSDGSKGYPSINLTPIS